MARYQVQSLNLHLAVRGVDRSGLIHVSPQLGLLEGSLGCHSSDTAMRAINLEPLKLPLQAYMQQSRRSNQETGRRTQVTRMRILDEGS